MLLPKQKQEISKILMKTLIENIFKSIINQYELNGGVAQLVEHRTHKPGVGGSIPPPATIFIVC